VRCLAGRFGERHLDHAFDHFRRQGRPTRRPRRFVQQPVDAFGHKN
jgi:hypothetical protein